MKTNYDLGGGLVVVMTDVDPAAEDEYQAWYNEEHFPERAAIDGVLWGQRYRLVSGDGERYLALFGLRDVSVLESEQYTSLPVSPRTQSLIPSLRAFTRGVYEFLPPSTFAK